MTKVVRWTAALVTVAITFGVATSASGFLVDLMGHWSASLVAALEARGIVAGDTSGRFEPDAPLTRAQMAKLLVVGLGSQGDAELLARYPSRFRDIPAWHWAKGYVESLAESGVTDGYPDGAFGPSDTVTRAQMAVFLVRAAGLSEQARLQRFSATWYRDDREIPEWARGAVQVALTQGLMAGFEDNTFRPQRPITKAEGGVAIFRLLAMRGELFHLSGTLVEFDTATLQGRVRTDLGEEKAFAMAPAAQYYHSGNIAAKQSVALLDQVWIVFGTDGKGRFMDLRYMDLTGTDVSVDSLKVTLTTPQGVRRTFPVQTGALIFLNGRRAALEQIQGAPTVYVAIDRVTSDVRVVDAVNAPLSAMVIRYDLQTGSLAVEGTGEIKLYEFAPDAVLTLDGERIKPSNLLPNDRVQMAVDQNGRISYLQAER